MATLEADIEYDIRDIGQRLCREAGRHKPHLSLKLTGVAPRFDPLDAAGTQAKILSLHSGTEVILRYQHGYFAYASMRRTR